MTNPEPEKPRKPVRVDLYKNVRTDDVMDSPFKGAFDAFYKEIQKAHVTGWKSTSRETARKYVQILSDYIER
jgi:hypothetical protein